MKYRNIIFILAVLSILYITSSYFTVYVNPVTGASTAYDAVCISSSFPSRMFAGESKDVSIIMKNRGRKAWDNDYFLDSRNSPADLWMVQRVRLDDVDVKSGETHNFRFTITAPEKEETYGSDWQMYGVLRPSGGDNFGELCRNEISVIDKGSCIVSEEICDGIDNDCDRYIDDNVTNVCGYCGIVPEEICDNRDNDCDSAIDEGCVRECIDSDNDGYCLDVDCNDNDGSINSGMNELCDDNVDNNCNQHINEGCKTGIFLLKEGSGFILKDKNVYLFSIYDDGSIRIEVDNDEDTVSIDELKNVGGLKIKILEYVPSDEKEDRRVLVSFS